jgi:hypothetical protein
MIESAMMMPNRYQSDDDADSDEETEEE